MCYENQVNIQMLCFCNQRNIISKVSVNQHCIDIILDVIQKMKNRWDDERQMLNAGYGTNVLYLAD